MRCCDAVMLVKVREGLEALEAMGFRDRERNERVLRRHGGSVERALAVLCGDEPEESGQQQHGTQHHSSSSIAAASAVAASLRGASVQERDSGTWAGTGRRCCHAAVPECRCRDAEEEALPAQHASSGRTVLPQRESEEQRRSSELSSPIAAWSRLPVPQQGVELRRPHAIRQQPPVDLSHRQQQQGE